jgi:GDP-L-fucose synthase
MKVLIVGSSGLVGSSLKRKLKDSKKITEVIASNRSDTDLFSFDETKNLIENTRPNVLVIAAAKVGGIFANNNLRVEFLLENLKINTNLMEACIPFPDIEIVNLGSSCIYPLNAENPIKEEAFMDGKLEPTNSPYAMAKLTAIELGRSLNKQYGHKVLNLMPTNLYGPNDYFNSKNAHVIPGLISRMHHAKINNEKEFSIWGSGKPLREFLFVDDLSEAINFLIGNDLDADLINIGSGFEISIDELAVLIKKTIDYEGNLIFDKEMPDGNPRKLLDSSLINNLGWKASTDLKKGLDITYKWYVDNFEKVKI